jgi:citrate synthase
MASYYSAQQAAARLGVSRQTLYSYVSRGLLRAHPGDSHRERRYLAVEVHQLAARRSQSRSPVRAAAEALNWGLPVIESSICCIDAGRLYYRGKDVLALIGTHSVEAAAALLWQRSEEDAFAVDEPFSAKIPIGRIERETMKSLMAAFARAGRNLPTDSWQAGAARSARQYGNLVRVLAGCVLGTAPRAEPLREQCAKAWGLSVRRARLLETALILCADHELNASSFAVRCIASTGASLHACVLGGLAALSGPQHGGMTMRVESMWNEVGENGNPEAHLRGRLGRGEPLPGFGHPLYPDGDVRAKAILNQITGRRQRWNVLVRAVRDLTGLQPTVDFALVAMSRDLELPAGSALSIFALARSIGWIAHALEQRAEGRLIRPRAAYIGSPPEQTESLSML